ncbi:hypothetical protein [Pseudophaeobacter sp.]|jgi:O-antigen/teichoic acid export membrane protein|uniref:lipopolysaccharide biosynthesis protein n=1 Tax=Pseudophaeobacter sp. TaxID=1971739 RepID=UPI0025FD228B|nr:hypothetical protein [uncultured Pseudophaeobacter sp.]
MQRLYVLIVVGMRLLGAGTTFLVSLLAARVLGADLAGQFILSINATLLLAIVARQGADNLALKVVAILANRLQSSEIALFLRRNCARSLRISVPISAAIFAFLALSSWPEDQEAYREIWLWMGPTLVFLAIMGILSTTFQALDKTLMAICFQSLGVNAAVIGALAGGITSPGGLAAVFFLASVVLVGVGSLEIARSLSRLHPRAAQVTLEPMPNERGDARAGRAFWVIAIFQNLQVWGAHYIAGAVLKPADLSGLVIAQQCALVLTLILQAVIMIYAPRFAVLHREGRLAELERLYQAVVLRVTTAVMPVFLLLFLAPGYVLSIFGEEFSEGRLALQILAVGQLLNAMTGPVGMLLMMTGHEHVYRNMFLIIVPVALLCSVGIGVVFGVIGFAAIVAVTLASTNIIATWLVWHRVSISPVPWVTRR